MNNRPNRQTLGQELAAARSQIASLEARCRSLEARARGLQAQAEERRALFRGLPSPVYVWQIQGDDLVLVDHNDTADDITGGRVVALLGTRAGELYRDEPAITADMWRCLREQCDFSREMHYRLRTTGEPRYLAVSYGFVPPDMVLVQSTDLTGHAVAEQTLKR